MIPTFFSAEIRALCTSYLPEYHIKFLFGYLLLKWIIVIDQIKKKFSKMIKMYKVKISTWCLGSSRRHPPDSLPCMFTHTCASEWPCAAMNVLSLHWLCANLFENGGKIRALQSKLNRCSRKIHEPNLTKSLRTKLGCVEAQIFEVSWVTRRPNVRRYGYVAINACIFATVLPQNATFSSVCWLLSRLLPGHLGNWAQLAWQSPNFTTVFEQIRAQPV